MKPAAESAAISTARIGWAAMLAVLAALSGCGGADARRASHLARGERYLEAGNLEKARVELGNVLQIAPNDPEGRYLSGVVAERLGNVRRAAAFYQGALDVDPEQLAARAALARLYALSRVPDKALELAEPGLAKHPDDPDLLAVRAAARSEQRDAAGALTDAERAVQLAPLNENAVSLLAALYRQAGQTQRATALLGATLAKKPESVDLHLVLANLYLDGGETRLAESQIVAAVRARPADLGLRLQLASFYTRARRLDEAQRALEEALAVAPDSDEAKLVYADFLATQRSRAAGEKALRGFIAREPRNYALQLGLGDLERRSGDPAGAAATYRAIVAQESDVPAGLAARDRIAAIDAAAQRYPEALKLVDEVLAREPRDDDALTVRGNIEIERGDAVAAIADLRAVSRDQPESVPVLRSLARAHLANGEPQLAEENLRAALKAAPADASVRLELARLLLEMRRVDNASELLEQGVRAAPAEASLREGLVRAYLAKPDVAAARAAVRELMTMRPDLAVGPYLAGLIAQQEKRPEEAQRQFERALKLQPSAMDALAALAELEAARGERSRAVALVKGVVERDPTSASARNLLGELYLGGRDYDAAVASLSEAIRLAPRWWPPYRSLAAARLSSGDRAGAEAAYLSGVKATGEVVLVTGLAALYESEGRVDAAIAQYEALYARNPHLAIAANNLAMLLVTYRSSDEASLDRARDLTAAFATSDVAAFLDTHGWVMLKRGEVPRAMLSLERASARSPESRVIRYHLGMAEIEAGEPEKARADLESALAGGASFTGVDEARAALAELKRRAG